MKNKKKAFTLTELLIVVIVIGVLAALVLPKFTRVMETRNTTEAEEIMTAIRTEQEARCALSKPYTTNFAHLTQVASLPEHGGSQASRETDKYTYTLQEGGVSAQQVTTQDTVYTLQMPSYADGRICCTGDGCNALNKDYIACETLIARADYEAAPQECTGENVQQNCEGSSTQSCGCHDTGTQTRVCNTATGQWGGWSACSVPDCQNCEGTPANPQTQSCTPDGYNTACGTQSRSQTCNEYTGQWQWGDWGDCNASSSCGEACSQEGTREVESCTASWDYGGLHHPPCGERERFCRDGHWSAWSRCARSNSCCDESTKNTTGLSAYCYECQAWVAPDLPGDNPGDDDNSAHVAVPGGNSFFSFYYTGECIETCLTGLLSTAPECEDGDAVLIGDRFICENNGEWRPVPCSQKYPVRCGCYWGSHGGPH